MIQAVVTDIEGTTTAVSFVYDVLFPYARAHLGAFVRAHAGDPAVRSELEAVSRETGRALADEEALTVLERWIDDDRKATPLKALQGMVWEAGFRSGAFTGHLYPDAVDRLRRWHAEGVALYVYSSGSVEAQKLLFGYSDYGDLTPLFQGYFDTRVGAKREPDSYRRIAQAIDLPAEAILFLSDVEAELDAACAAGMRTCWLVREGALDADAAHPQARTFAEVDPGARRAS